MSNVKKPPSDDGPLPEGIYSGSVDKVAFEPDTGVPKKVILHFKIPESNGMLLKEYPYSLRNDSTLRKDTEVLIGRSVTQQELNNGFDFDQFLGKKANLGVFHRAGAGGKPAPAVALVFPLEKAA